MKLSSTKKVSLTLISLCLSLVASVSATFAWYQFYVSASLTYDGTAIGTSTVFEIGLIDNNATTPTWYSGNLTSEVLKTYLTRNGYATNYLYGVTTGSYTSGNTFTLKSRPSALNNITTTAAPTKEYIRLALAFRNRQQGSTTGVTTQSNVRITNINVNGVNSVQEAIRLGFDSTSFKGVVKPNSTSSGSTTVGGALNLDGDEYYDYETVMEVVDGMTVGVDKEFYYGESSNTITYSDAPTSDGTAPTTADTFHAIHKAGVKPISTATTNATASYYGSTDLLDTTRIVSTIDATTGIGYLNLYIYLEGWDYSYIDSVAGSNFGLSFTFEGELQNEN